MTENQVNTIQYVVNFRYGGRPVKKVYLGKKLIWQCIDTYGQSESKSYSQIIFYNLESEILSVEVESETFNQAIAKSFEGIAFNGISVSNTLSKEFCNILDSILMLSTLQGKNYTNNACNNLKAIIIRDSNSNYTDIKAESQALRVIIIDEKIETLSQYNNICMKLKILAMKEDLQLKSYSNNIYTALRAIAIEENLQEIIKVFGAGNAKETLPISDGEEISFELRDICTKLKVKPVEKEEKILFTTNTGASSKITSAMFDNLEVKTRVKNIHTLLNTILIEEDLRQIIDIHGAANAKKTLPISDEEEVKIETKNINTLLETILVEEELRQTINTQGAGSSKITSAMFDKEEIIIDIKDICRVLEIIILENFSTSQTILENFCTKLNSILLKEGLQQCILVSGSTNAKKTLRLFESFEQSIDTNNVFIPVKTILNISKSNSLMQVHGSGRMPIVEKVNGVSNNFTDSVALFGAKLQIKLTNITQSFSFIEAALRLVTPVFADGISNNSTKGKALVVTFPTKILEGKGESDNFVESQVKVYQAVAGNFELGSSTFSEVKAKGLVWFPPIGDEIPLNPNDDINISANGNTLEIKQAFQVKVDKTNRRLEIS